MTHSYLGQNSMLIHKHLGSISSNPPSQSSLSSSDGMEAEQVSAFVPSVPIELASQSNFELEFLFLINIQL